MPPDSPSLPLLAPLPLLLLAGCAEPAPVPAVRGPPDEGAELDQPRPAPPRDSGTEEPVDSGETGLVPPEDSAEPEPEDSALPEDTAVPPDTGDAPLQACYLGAWSDGSTCLPLVQPGDLGADYVYPEPYGGDPQYREPLAWLDLEVEDPDLALAPNFLLSELAQEWKGRWAVVQPHAVERVQAVRDQVGLLVVNSGYRSPAYNASVGGVSSSRHMYGDAFDLDPGESSLDALADACAAQGAGYVGVYDTHIHCDWRNDPVDEAFFGPAPSSLRAAPLPVHRAELQADGEGWRAPAEGWDEGEPLREWTARDAAGRLLSRGTGLYFLPPAGTRELSVVVGRRIHLSRTLGP